MDVNSEDNCYRFASYLIPLVKADGTNPECLKHLEFLDMSSYMTLEYSGTFWTEMYNTEPLYDEPELCNRYNYLIREYYEQGLRGDDLTEAVSDSMSDPGSGYCPTVFYGLPEEESEFDEQDMI